MVPHGPRTSRACRRYRRQLGAGTDQASDTPRAQLHVRQADGQGLKLFKGCAVVSDCAGVFLGQASHQLNWLVKAFHSAPLWP